MAAGAMFLFVSAAASGVLVSKHFGVRAPGCGPLSACDALEATIWGKVPGIGWPTSFVGLAFFLGMLATWLVGRGRVPLTVLCLAGFSVAASLVLIGVMMIEAKLCPYCMGAHAGNLGFFVLAVVWGRTRQASSVSARTAKGATKVIRRAAVPMAAGIGAGVFAAVSGGLGVLEAQHRERLAAKAEAERRESSSKIVAGSGNSQPAPPDRWGAAGFTGRYRLGPELAAIRIVVLTDYQCPDCKRVEGEIEDFLAGRTDVSLSVKHFPMCLEAAPGQPCNKYAGRTLHPNACWAARAAEAAGILGGDVAYFKMHRWLFAHGGRFETQEEIAAGVRDADLDPAAFLPVMSGPETLKRIRADAEDGMALGIYFTPMVFINGVEMKGWQVPGAVKRTLEEVAATSPPPPARTAAADRPALAADKFVQDWKDQPVVAMPPDQRTWRLGAAAASPPGATSGGARVVDVVVFGDYQERFTAQVDGEVRAALVTRPAVRYTFRHYPVNKDCNPILPAGVPAAAVHPQACTAARAAEAAGSIGGESAYWKMHEWLMGHQQAITPEGLKAGAESAGIDSGALMAALAKPETGAPIEEDCRAAQRLGLTSVPMVFVDGRLVPRAVREGDMVMTRIIDRALAPKP